MEQTLNFSDSVIYIFWSMVVFIIVWSIIWKAIALWHAARNNHKIWYVVMIVVNTFGILEIIYIVFVSKSLNRPTGSYMVDSKSKKPEPVAPSTPKVVDTYKSPEMVSSEINSTTSVNNVPTNNPTEYSSDNENKI